MLSKFFQANGDTLVYGGIAKNLLLHGRYALTLESGETFSTLIRLPGYPLFLAACFRLFGMENLRRGGVGADCAGAGWLRAAGGFRAPHCASAVSHRCCAGHAVAGCAVSVYGVYAATPLTETPTLFVLALALWAAARFTEQPGWGAALWFTFAVTYAALLRPDGALAAVALAPALLVRSASGAKAAAVRWRADGRGVRTAGAGAVRDMDVAQLAGVSRVQPLAPRSATDPARPATRAGSAG